MAETADIMTAIEGYLAKSGKGDNYLATKITELFESVDSPLNINGNSLLILKEALHNLADTVHDLDDSVFMFKSASTGFSQSISKFSKLKLPDFTKLKLPNFSKMVIPDFTKLKAPDFSKMHLSATKFSEELKTFGSRLPSFFQLNTVVGSLTRKLLNIDAKLDATPPPTPIAPVPAPPPTIPVVATTTPTIESILPVDQTVNVNVVSMSDALIKQITSSYQSPSIKNGLLGKKNSGIDDLITELRYHKKESPGGIGGMISSILHGIVGGVALLAGAGFLIEFLKTPLGQRIATTLGNVKDKIMEKLSPVFTKIKELFVEYGPPLMEAIGHYAWEGLKFIGKLLKDAVLTSMKFVGGYVWDFFTTLLSELPTQVFNFFGLKDMMGAEGQGIAVILTKSIFYGIKGAVLGTMSKLTFGISDVIGKKVMTGLGKLGSVFSTLGDHILKPVAALTDSLAVPAEGGILSKLTTPLKSMTKLLGGSVFKIIGTLFKKVASKIPFIGALISFHDGWQRLSSGDIVGGIISFGSGIASCFPFLGTAVSIGLDVLNAFIDSSNEGNPTRSTGIVFDFIGKTMTYFLTRVNSLFQTIFDTIWNGIRDAGKAILDKTGVSWLADKASSAWSYVADVVTPVNDASIVNPGSGVGIKSGAQIVQPSDKDQVIAMQTGGPFDLALKEMTNKLTILIGVVSEGVNLIADTSVAGSANIVNSVLATANKGNSPTPNYTQRDPIGDYRIRARRAIEFVS